MVFSKFTSFTETQKHYYAKIKRETCGAITKKKDVLIANANAKAKFLLQIHPLEQCDKPV